MCFGLLSSLSTLELNISHSFVTRHNSNNYVLVNMLFTTLRLENTGKFESSIKCYYVGHGINWKILRIL